jgi:hypothetical protein
MDMTKDLVAASATPLVLAILAEGDNYGYAIIKRVAELSGGHLQWTDGMLYPVLHRLERQGLVAAKWSTSENGRKRPFGLPRHELHRGVPPPLGPKPAHILQRGRRPVLVGVGALDFVADSGTVNADGTDPDLPIAHLKRPERIVEECPVPAVLPPHPRSGKHAAVDHHSPNSNEPMVRPRAGPDSQDHALVNRFHGRP